MDAAELSQLASILSAFSGNDLFQQVEEFARLKPALVFPACEALVSHVPAAAVALLALSTQAPDAEFARAASAIITHPSVGHATLRGCGGGRYGALEAARGGALPQCCPRMALL